MANHNENKEHTYVDLDDMMKPSQEEDSLDESKSTHKEDHKQSKKNKRKRNENADFENATKSTRDKNKNKFSIWKVFKKHIMMPLIGFIVGIIVAIFLFGGSSSPDENEEVYEVDNSISIEDQIDNVRSSQIDAIRQQFSSLREQGADTDEEDKIVQSNESMSKSIDPFLKEVMNTPFNPSEKELKARANKLQDIAKGDEDESNFDKVAIDYLLKGNSAAKELNEPGVKSGSTFSSVIGSDKKNNNVYLTITPFTTKDKTVNAVYLIKADSNGQFVTGTYIGYIQSSDKNRAKDTFSYLANIVKGDVNTKQVNKAIANDVEKVNRQIENTDQKKEDNSKKEGNSKKEDNSKKDAQDKKSKDEKQSKDKDKDGK